MDKAGKKRLHFGVVFPSLDNSEKYNLLQDIENYAIGHDIHITAYFGTYAVRNEGFASHYEPCFEAIRRSKVLDGLVIYTGFIAHNIGTDKLTNYVKSIAGAFPVISIGMEIPGTYCVMSDNTAGLYVAVDHLIKTDGKKRIAFIKGPDGHPEAEARFSGYLKALADNGIERDDELILPGDFTPNGGHLAMNELIDVRRIPFDAIAGCNDECAMGAMSELKDRGYTLPDDVGVTGFDDVAEAATFSTPLSSVRQDFSKLGTIAIEALRSINSKKTVDDIIYVVPDFITRCSCGCGKDDRRIVTYQDNANMHARMRRMVADNLILEFNLESLGTLMRESLPAIAIDFALVGVYHEPFACVNSGDRSIDMLFGFDAEQEISMKGDNDSFYPLSDYTIIKDFDFERERRTLFFLPLIFGDEERGAALIAYNSFNPVNWYESLRTNVAAAVKGANLIEKIQTLSVTDELTGLLNRRGLMQQIYTRLTYLQREPGYYAAVFAVDMDGLKFINDTYGHAEGDVAIKIFADILSKSIRMGDIIGRIGGDEFIILTVVKSKNDIARLEARIRQELDNYNAEKRHPFSVLGSIGTAMLAGPTNEAFDHAMLEADNALYEEKQEKRKKGLSRG